MARFLRKGKTRIIWVEATVIPDDAAKINAGIDIDVQVNEVTGFAFSNQPINTMSMDTDFVSQIPGENSVEQSSLTFYDDDTGSNIKNQLAKGDSGYVVFLPEGGSGSGTPAAAASSDRYEIWPVDVSANVNLYTTANEAAMFRVDFAVTGEPTRGVIA